MPRKPAKAKPEAPAAPPVITDRWRISNKIVRPGFKLADGSCTRIPGLCGRCLGGGCISPAK